MAQNSRQNQPYLETGSARLARERENPPPLLPTVTVQFTIVGVASPPSPPSYLRACWRARRLPARAELRQVREIPGGRR